MGSGYTFAFLIIGAVLVFIDGWLLRRSGTTYLSAVYPDNKVADSVNQLVTVLFHLTTLGVVALVSTLPMGGSDPFTAMVTRLGALFLVLAAAHGITILIMARMRSRQRDKVLQEEITSRTSEHFDAKPEAGTA